MDFNKLEHLIRKCSHVGSKYRFQIYRKDNKIVYSVEAPAGNYMSNVNNRNPRTKCEICSNKGTGVFIVNFEHISYLVVVFLWLTLSK